MKGRYRSVQFQVPGTVLQIECTAVCFLFCCQFQKIMRGYNLHAWTIEKLIHACTPLFTQYGWKQGIKKITSLNIQLSKKIIPECLHLGMKGILYPAFFHLGNVKSEGGTSYYSGSDVNNAGSKIYKVHFCHSRLQIVFLSCVAWCWWLGWDTLWNTI